MILNRVEKFLGSDTWQRLVGDGYFKTSSDKSLNSRVRDVWKFLDGVAAADDELRDEGAARRFVYNLCDIFKDVAEAEPTKMLQRVETLRKYFHGQYAGQKDTSQ